MSKAIDGWMSDESINTDGLSITFTIEEFFMYCMT